jgi:O-antigen/teichoic acid export membrane protein
VAPSLDRSASLRGGYSWAIGEQFGFSVSQVLIQVVASRALSQGDYGIFALVNATTLLLLRVHYAFLIEPVLVLYPAVQPAKQPDTLHAVVTLQFKVEAALALLCAGLAAIAWAHSVSSALLVLGATTFCLGAVAMNFRRRIAYLTGGEQGTFWSTAFRGAASVVALLATDEFTGLSAWSALFVVGICFFLPGIRPRPTSAAALAPQIRRQLFEHGRFALVVLIVWGAIDAAPHYVLAVVGGAQAVAAYQVAAALFGPLVQLAGTVLTAALPRIVVAKGKPRAVLGLALWGLALTALGSLGVALVGPTLIPLVFGERYTASAELLLPLAPFPVFLIAAHLLGNWNKAQGRQGPLLTAALCALPLMGIALAVGHSLGGVYGASFGVTLGYASFAALLALGTVRRRLQS